MKSRFLSFRYVIPGTLVLFLLVAASLSVFLAQQQSNVQSNAATVSPPPTTPACIEGQPTDIMLVFDTSSSMGYVDDTTTTRLYKAQVAGDYFADKFATLNASLPSGQQYQIGVVRFADFTPSDTDIPPYTWPHWSRIMQGLTTNMSAVKSAINNLYWPDNFAFTCIECGLRQAYTGLQSSSRPKAIVLLTDGIANWRDNTTDLIWDPSDFGDAADWPYAPNHPISEGAALSLVNNNLGIPVYTVGISQVNATFLQTIANNTGGLYRYTSDGTGLTTIYNEIADSIHKTGSGIVTGTVYNDANNNGQKDLNESGLGGWSVTIEDSTTGQTIATTTTDQSGGFTISGICSGTYTVSEVPQPGWIPTAPTGGQKTLTISPGSTQTVSFGNFQGLSISGSVFIDNNNDNTFNAGDTLYPGTVSMELDGVQKTSSSSYSYTGITTGQHTVRLLIPSGYTAVPPPPSSFVVNLYPPPQCSIVNPPAGAQCTSNGVINLNFALHPMTSSWIQSESFDARIDGGYNYQNPATNTCPGGTYASVPGAAKTPGVIFSGNANPIFGSSQASYYINGTTAPYNWKVGGPFGETYGAKALRLSYSTALAAAKQTGKVQNLTDQNTCKNAQQCSLLGVPAGYYQATGSVHFTDGIFIQSGVTIIFAQGDVTFDRPVVVNKGAFFMVISGNSIHVTSDLGTAPTCSPDSQLDGFYVANHDFIVEHGNTCAAGGDKMLQAAGAVVVNASGQGGNFLQNRILCADAASYPAFRIRPRLDMLFLFPDFLMTPTRSWQEVAPENPSP